LDIKYILFSHKIVIFLKEQIDDEFLEHKKLKK